MVNFALYRKEDPALVERDWGKSIPGYVFAETRRGNGTGTPCYVSVATMQFENNDPERGVLSIDMRVNDPTLPDCRRFVGQKAIDDFFRLVGGLVPHDLQGRKVILLDNDVVGFEIRENVVESHRVDLAAALNGDGRDHREPYIPSSVIGEDSTSVFVSSYAQERGVDCTDILRTVPFNS